MRRLFAITFILIAMTCASGEREGGLKHGGLYLACAKCHIDKGKFPPSEVCFKCHPSRNDHPLVPVKERKTSLPLSENGVMECYTCHKVHSTEKKLLRVSPSRLCMECHPEK